MRRVALILCVAFSPILSSCAAQMLQSAQNECSAFGFSAGTNEYASCVQQQYSASRQRFSSALSAAGQSLSNNGGYAPTYGGTASGTAFLKSSYVSGMNRVCVYNRLGSAYVITIGAAEICPISVP